MCVCLVCVYLCTRASVCVEEGLEKVRFPRRIWRKGEGGGRVCGIFQEKKELARALHPPQLLLPSLLDRGLQPFRWVGGNYQYYFDANKEKYKKQLTKPVR